MYIHLYIYIYIYVEVRLSILFTFTVKIKGITVLCCIIFVYDEFDLEYGKKN